MIFLNIYNKMTSVVASPVENDPDKRVKKLIQKAFTCEAIETLYDRVKNISPGGDWQISFVSRDMFVALATGAFCFYQGRNITLATDLTDDQALSALVFEFTNAVKTAQFEVLDKQCEAGTIDCETYTKKIEELEYSGTELHHQIMQKAIKELGWNRKVDEFKNYLS